MSNRIMLNNKQLINTKVWNKDDSSPFEIHWQFLLQHVKQCRSPSDEVVYSGLGLNATAPSEQAARLSLRVFNERTAWLPLSLAHSNITCTVSGAHTFTPCLTQPLCERDALIPAWLTLTVWTCPRFRRLLTNLLPTFGETKPPCFL